MATAMGASMKGGSVMARLETRPQALTAPTRRGATAAVPSGARSALAPGGQLVVLDQMRRSAGGGTARAVVELTNLRLFDPAHGGTYALPELRGWLADLGLCKIRNHRLFSVPWAALVVAQRDSTPLASEATHRSRIDRAESDREATR